MFELGDFRSDDAFEAVEYYASAQSFKGICPVGPVPKTYCVMVPIRVPESEEQAPRRLEAQGVDQFLAQQSHGSRAKQHDTLLV